MNPQLIESVNPATGEFLAHTEISSPSEIQEQVKRARLAFAGWSKLTIGERLAYINRFREILCNRKMEIARLISTECGKPILESLAAEVLPVLESCSWLQKHAGALLSPRALKLNQLLFTNSRASLIYEPRGIVAVISPWNFPFSIPANTILTALAAGNCVILKSSPRAVLVAKVVLALFKEAGFPEHTVQLICGDSQEARELILAGPDYLVFTGSVKAGKAIMQLASQKLLPLTLELGGKHPAIVLEDADLEACADSIVWSAFTNAGQACASIERLYVLESRYSELLELLKEKILRLKTGDPLDESSDVGPMISFRERQRVLDLISNACKDGASIICGGKACKSKAEGSFLEPTLLAGTNEEMEIMKREIFGPVLPVVKVASIEEALNLANNSSYGLGASIWSKNRKEAEKIAGRLNCGMVWINDGLFSHACPDTPWGGIKESGFGRSHGKESLMALVNHKVLTSTNAGFRLWNFPYSKNKTRALKASIDTLHAGSLSVKLRSAFVLLLSWFKERFC